MTTSRQTPIAPCRHCRRVLTVRARGLCSRCYGVPQIRARYASVSKFAAHAPHGKPEDEPTMAELDAMIAERSRPENLPSWWDNSSGYGTYKPRRRAGRTSP